MFGRNGMSTFSLTRNTVVFGLLGILLASFCVYKLFLSGQPAAALRAELLNSGKAKVKEVYSGNKIKIKPSDHLVYAGMRAPEKEEPFGQEAFERNRVLVAGKSIHVQFDEKQKDKKGQWVGYVFVGNDMVNRRLVAEGLAYVKLRDGQKRFAKELLDAQKEAQAARRGLWKQPIASTQAKYPGDRKNASFHLPNCPDLPNLKPENAVTFTSKQEAFNAGFAPCEHCKP